MVNMRHPQVQIFRKDKNVLLSNVTKYQHSYYGNLLLRLANSKGKIDNKKIVFFWVINNLRLHNVYASALWPPNNEKDAPESKNWRKNYVMSVIKGISFFTWIIYSILCKIPVRFLLKIKI